MQFKDLNIMPSILKALEDENYATPTPIQEQAIPPVLEGRDLLGCAQTGTGKTAAFAIPALQLLSENAGHKNAARQIRGIVITPTRELALQIYESFCAYGKYTDLKYAVVFGGVSQKPQEEILKNGVDILVATPGRLNDLINQKIVDLSHIKILILDEADRMLDMGFINDVKKIIAKVPAKKQTLLFSATMPVEIAHISDSLLHDPVKVEVTPVSSTAEKIRQYIYFVDKENKKNILQTILEDKSIESVLVFTRTKHGADKVVRQLSKSKISAKAIHGDKSQSARQQALSDFKEKNVRVLVATDIAARGIDIDELTHVINYDLPNIPETYVHRIGRTGRAGLGGTAISFCDFEEMAYLKDIKKLIGDCITEVEDHPFPLMNTTIAPKATQPRAKKLNSAGEPLAENKAGSRFAKRPASKSEARTGSKNESRQDSRSDSKAGSVNKKGTRPGAKTEARTPNGTRKESRPATKSGNRSGNRPAPSLGGRPEIKTGSSAGYKSGYNSSMSKNTKTGTRPTGK